MRIRNTYFIAKYDTKIVPIKNALGKKRLVIVLCFESALENPQNTASLRVKSRLAEKYASFTYLYMQTLPESKFPIVPLGTNRAASLSNRQAI